MNRNQSFYSIVKPIRSFLPALVVAAALGFPIPESLAKDSASGSGASADLKLARSLNQAFIELAEQVEPSVVVINVETKNDPNALMDHPGFEGLPEFFRKQLEQQLEERQEQKPRQRPPTKRGRPNAPVTPNTEIEPEPRFNGEGSGIILREEGYILTNNHVVENAARIRVRLKDGREFDAEVRGLDPASDLAVVKLKGNVTGLVPAKFADSDKIRVGEFAIAVGAPFHLDYSVTFGHISAKGREDIGPTQMWDQQFLQTDARINPGNSGGPLVNIEGEVMGVNSMIRGLESGIGFSIPSNLALEVADRLITDGKITRSWLGIRIGSLRNMPEMKSVAAKIKDGVVVRAIQADGPAAKSELEVFDVITAVDGKPVSTDQGLRTEISRKHPNVEVALRVHRADQDITIKVRPEPIPDYVLAAKNGTKPQPMPEPEVTEDHDYLEKIGLTVEPLTKQSAKAHKLDPQTKGLLVTGVEEKSVAAKNSLEEGDVITRVGDQKVTTIQELSDALSTGGESGRIRLRYFRDGTSTGTFLRSLPKQ